MRTVVGGGRDTHDGHENSPILVFFSNLLVNSSDWVLLSRNQAFLDLEVVREDEEPMPAPGTLWTDDFSSLWEVVELSD